MLDPTLNPAEQRQIAAELLDDEEITEILISLCFGAASLPA